MKTRLVRRRRAVSPLWAVLVLIPLLIAYMVLAKPALENLREYVLPVPQAQAPAAAQHSSARQGEAERITREIEIGGLTLYLIQFGQYADADLARVEAARYVARGAAGYVYEGTRVVGAGYEAHEDAQKVAARLTTEEGIEAEVVAVQSRALTLRVTAVPAQIEALATADRALREAAAALGAAALALDRGEIPLADALVEAAARAGAVEAAYLALASQVDEAHAGIAADYVRLLRASSDALQRLSQEKPTSALAFSSKMKYNGIELRLMHIAFINQLT